jgi:hypothetical protein
VDGAKIAIHDRYAGAVSEAETARANIEALGGCEMALLANHGALEVAEDIANAFVTGGRGFERRCWAAWGATVLGGCTPMDSLAERPYVELMTRGRSFGSPIAWAAAVRRELWEDRELLTRTGSWWGAF